MPGGSSSHRPLRCVVLLLLLAVLSNSPAWCDYVKIYRDGITAFDRRNWDDLARLMQEAIRENPSSGGNKVRMSGGGWTASGCFNVAPPEPRATFN